MRQRSVVALVQGHGLLSSFRDGGDQRVEACGEPPFSGVWILGYICMFIQQIGDEGFCGRFQGGGLGCIWSGVTHACESDDRERQGWDEWESMHCFENKRLLRTGEW